MEEAARFVLEVWLEVWRPSGETTAAGLLMLVYDAGGALSGLVSRFSRFKSVPMSARAGSAAPGPSPALY